MNTYQATEIAYKNGYEAGKQDAMKWIPVTEMLPKPYVDVITLRQDLLKAKEYKVICRLSNIASVQTVKPQTNADRIRAMTDEELAEFLCGVYDNDEDYAKFINGHLIPCYNPHSIKEWLQQPAEGDA